jgi:hypothetical protein
MVKIMMKRLSLLSLLLVVSACDNSSAPGNLTDLSATAGDMSASGSDFATPNGGDGGETDGGTTGDLATPPDLLPPNFGCATVPGVAIPISGHITADRTLACTSLYLFQGIVIVDAGATLTLEKGVTIEMDLAASLIIAPGAKIVAVGTAVQPIVFTSAKLPSARVPGDWGTLALVGKAPGNWGTSGTAGVAITQSAPNANDWPGSNNGTGPFPYQAGGGADNDSSGTMTYVRLEYGGKPGDATGANTTDHEMLGMYGVGSGTTIEYIDMRQANFGCLFAEGGDFLAKHLVCQWSGNGGFDFTRGNRSKAQFLIDQESPFKSAEGLGFKGPGDANQLAPLTAPIVYNVTVIATNESSAAIKDPYAFFMVRSPAGGVYNFIGTGFRAGVSMTGGSATNLATTTMMNSILYGNVDANTPGTNIAYPNGVNGNIIDLGPWYNTSGWMNTETNPALQEPLNTTILRAGPTQTLTTGAATPPNDGFFDTTAAYIGAFQSETESWVTGSWVVWSNK